MGAVLRRVNPSVQFSPSPKMGEGRDGGCAPTGKSGRFNFLLPPKWGKAGMGAVLRRVNPVG
jgi:hypothetical protein